MKAFKSPDFWLVWAISCAAMSFQETMLRYLEAPPTYRNALIGAIVAAVLLFVAAVIAVRSDT